MEKRTTKRKGEKMYYLKIKNSNDHIIVVTKENSGSKHNYRVLLLGENNGCYQYVYEGKGEKIADVQAEKIGSDKFRVEFKTHDGWVKPYPTYKITIEWRPRIGDLFPSEAVTTKNKLSANEFPENSW